MLSEIVEHVVGVDPDRDTITVAALDARTARTLATERFPATSDGYESAVRWADAYSSSTDRAWAIEGSGSYGRGLTRVLQRRAELVVEFDHPQRRASPDGTKTDALDAIRAGREVLSKDRLNQPRSHDGLREAIRVHTVARAAAVRARTAAVNELKALIVTSDDDTRSQVRHLTAHQIIQRCARFRDAPTRPVDERCTRIAMRALARRCQSLDAEIAEHDTALRALIDEVAPQLVAERGVGYVTAAAFYLAWSHRGRCRSEAAFARLSGTAPIEVTSGQNQDRHRLCRGGDRQLNRALHLVAVTRQRCWSTTQAYIARRVDEGLTRREATRCIKRYIARRIWRLLEHPEATIDRRATT